MAQSVSPGLLEPAMGRKYRIVCANFCKLRKVKRAGERFFTLKIPRTHKISAARAVAHGRRLGAVGGKPPRMRGARLAERRDYEQRSCEGGVGGKAPRAFPDYLFAELSVYDQLSILFPGL